MNIIFKVYGESIEEQALANNSGKINPPSSFAAGLIGVEALLHSYAMSYRLDIKIVRIPDTIIYNNMPPGHFLMQILNNGIFRVKKFKVVKKLAMPTIALQRLFKNLNISYIKK